MRRMAGISVGTRFRANTGHAKGRTRWLLDGISRAMRRLLGGLKPDPAMFLPVRRRGASAGFCRRRLGHRAPSPLAPDNTTIDGKRRPLSSHCALPGRIAGVSVNARLRGRQKRRGSRAAHLPRRSAAGTLFSDAAQFLANSLVKTIRSGRIQRRRCRR